MSCPENPLRELRIANLRWAFHEGPTVWVKLTALEKFLRIVRADLLAAKFSTREVRFPVQGAVPPSLTPTQPARTPPRAR